MNEKQKAILKYLVDRNAQKYSELYAHFKEADKFPYHLKYLLTKGFVKKREEKYYLTKAGMQATSEFDTKTLEDIRYLKPLLLLKCHYKDKYFILEHFNEDTNPKRHLFTLPSAKPLWGETLEISAKKEFLRKHGILANFQYKNMFHLINKTTDGDTLFDNIFLIFEASISETEFLNCKKKHWLTPEELANMENTSITVKKLIIDNSNEAYIQDTVTLNYGIEENDL